MKPLKLVYKILYFFITCLILTGPALYMQYPIINGDSNNYIWQSLYLIGTATNPIGYSLFIRAMTWQFSLWPVVFAQGMIVSVLIYFILQTIFARNKFLLVRHFIIVTILSLFTGLAWISSQIMADIFVSISIMSIYLIFVPNSRLHVKIFATVCLSFSFILHFSIPLIAIAITLFFILHYLITLRTVNKAHLMKFALLLVVFLAASLFNKNYNSLFADRDNPPPIRHVLLMARVMETGILDEFLEENCDDSRYALCNYKDQFPDYPSVFVWSTNSIFSKTGSWNNSKEEYNEILYRIFTDPYYLSMFAYKGVISSAKQIFAFDIDVRWFRKSDRDQYTYDLIGTHFKHEEKKFKSSLQFKNVDLTIINRSYFILCGLSLIIVVFFFLTVKANYKSNIWLFSFIIMEGVIFNAMINGTFSNVVARYQARVNWMIVLLALIIIQKYFVVIVKYFAIKMNQIEDTENTSI